MVSNVHFNDFILNRVYVVAWEVPLLFHILITPILGFKYMEWQQISESNESEPENDLNNAIPFHTIQAAHKLI